MKPPLDRIGWGRKGVDSLHFGTIGEGPSIVSKIDPRLKIKGIFGVASHPKIFVEAMMGRAIEKGLGEIHIAKVIFVSGFAITVIEGHADVIFSDPGGGIAIALQHVGKRRAFAMNHRRVRSVRQPSLVF